ncbi:MAG: hypothetical protein ACPGVG_17205 [Mycobacterium sp.]
MKGLEEEGGQLAADGRMPDEEAIARALEGLDLDSVDFGRLDEIAENLKRWDPGHCARTAKQYGLPLPAGAAGAKPDVARAWVGGLIAALLGSREGGPPIVPSQGVASAARAELQHAPAPGSEAEALLVAYKARFGFPDTHSVEEVREAVDLWEQAHGRPSPVRPWLDATAPPREPPTTVDMVLTHGCGRFSAVHPANPRVTFDIMLTSAWPACDCDEDGQPVLTGGFTRQYAVVGPLGPRDAPVPTGAEVLRQWSLQGEARASLPGQPLFLWVRVLRHAWLEETTPAEPVDAVTGRFA